MPSGTAQVSSVAEVLAIAFSRALDGDPVAVGRLVFANAAVAFSIGTADGPGVALDLRGDVPDVCAAPKDADIHVVLHPQDIPTLAAGQVSLLTLLSAGLASATGPVRRYLEVDPIVTYLLRETAAQGTENLRRDAYPGAGTLQADALAIETRGLKKSFGSKAILDGLDLSIPEGAISVLLGPSGTGKSVLLRHVIGLLEPDAGDILVRGRSLVGLNEAETLELRCDVGVMFQDGALFSNMSVFDNVAFPLREHTDLDDAEVHEVVIQRLADLGLTNAATSMPSQLSGGMRKRAGLARALVLEPGIVLVDEPDSGLDPVRTSLLGDLLVDQHATNGGTMVVVTHNVPLARYISSHVSVVWNGKVVTDGPADDVFGSDDPFVKQFLARDTHGPLGMD